MYRTHLIRAETKVIDAEEGTVSAIVSTETPDRGGDIIRVSGWDLKPFKQHPVLVSGHTYAGTLMNQIGKWTEMKVNRPDKTLEGVAKYHIGQGNEEADWGFFLASQNMAAYSVGFIPDMDKAERITDEDDPDSWYWSYEFKGQELLEVSHVIVPANAEALQNAKTAGLHPVLDRIADDIIGNRNLALAFEERADESGAKSFLSSWREQPQKTPQSAIQEAIARWPQN